jgi:hypothetical protein
MNTLDFIEIGCSNFNTLIQTASDEDRGISIEPISYYLNKLPNKSNILKMHVGISDVEELRNFYYIPEHIIRKNKLPDWLIGCNSIDNIHPTALLNCEERGVDIYDIIETEEVMVIPLTKIIKTFDICYIKCLKVDTEGHDCIILNNILPLLYDKLKIDKIIFETNSLSSYTTQQDIINKLQLIGYTIISASSDTVLVRENLV